MTNWVTIRVPEANRDDAKEIRPENATHGDCLVAGAKALSGENPNADVDDLKAVAATPEDLTKLRGDILERMDTIESAAKEATQAAQSAEQSVEELQR